MAKSLSLRTSNSEVHLEVHSEGKNSEVHSEAQPEQSLSLQDCLNRECQSHTTEYQLHTNEVRLKQLPGKKEKDLSGSKG